MKDYFKSGKVICSFQNACANKSKSFCRECSRNFNIKLRDWFEPTENHKNLVKMIRRD